MKLYVFPGGGFFATDGGEGLPARVTVLPHGEHEVLLDGRSVPLTEGSFTLPTELSQGVHTLKVDGRLCEGIQIKNQSALPAGESFRQLLPALMRFYELERRVCALEERATEKEVNWLK